MHKYIAAVSMIKSRPFIKIYVFADVGLNIFYSARKYTEKDWVRHKVRHYPLPLLQMFELEAEAWYL